MSFYPLFSFSEISISVVVFDFTFAFVLGVLYVNLNFCPPFFVLSINIPKNLPHLMVIEQKFSTIFINTRDVECHWGNNKEILSP
jgi:hypothetical protein